MRKQDFLLITLALFILPARKKFILPFGFVQSPIISSLCLKFSKLGSYLDEIERISSLKVSVYVDDIIISSKSYKQLLQVLDRMNEVASRSHFKFNRDKVEGPAETITAFNIHLSRERLEIEEERMDLFIESFRKAYNGAQKRGIFQYICSVNPEQSTRLF